MSLKQVGKNDNSKKRLYEANRKHTNIPSKPKSPRIEKSLTPTMGESHFSTNFVAYIMIYRPKMLFSNSTSGESYDYTTNDY